MIDVNRRYVVSKVRELFGQYCSEDANIESVLENQLCPYNNKKCVTIQNHPYSKMKLG